MPLVVHYGLWVRLRQASPLERHMIEVLTDLGDAAFLLPGSVGLFAFLFWRGGACVALAWVMALVVCLMLTFVTKLAFMSLHACGATGLALNVVSPSGHTSLSLAFWGCLALVAGRGRGAAIRYMMYTAAGALVLAIGVTRVLRHDHSVAEVVGGILIGGASILVFASRQKKTRQITLVWQPLVVFAICLGAVAWLLSGQHVTAEESIREMAQKFASSAIICESNKLSDEVATRRRGASQVQGARARGDSAAPLAVNARRILTKNQPLYPDASAR